MLKRHEKKTKRLMGMAVLAVLGIFWGLHAAFPEVKLWPLGTVTLVIVTMVVSHFRRVTGGPEQRAVAEVES